MLLFLFVDILMKLGCCVDVIVLLRNWLGMCEVVVCVMLLGSV